MLPLLVPSLVSEDWEVSLILRPFTSLLRVKLYFLPLPAGRRYYIQTFFIEWSEVTTVYCKLFINLDAFITRALCYSALTQLNDESFYKRIEVGVYLLKNTRRRLENELRQDIAIIK